MYIYMPRVSPAFDCRIISLVFSSLLPLDSAMSVWTGTSKNGLVNDQRAKETESAGSRTRCERMASAHVTLTPLNLRSHMNEAHANLIYN